MGIKRQIEITPLHCIHPGKGLEICPLDQAATATHTNAEQPTWGHETTLVTLAPGTIEDLFVHHFQTDQLLVVQGCAVLIVLQNRQYRYIPMRGDRLEVVKIPPGVPHGAVNLSDRPCLAINSLIRHGPPHDRDYRPVLKPFPYDLAVVRSLLDET